MSKHYVNKSMDRGLRILDLFDEATTYLTASEIASSFDATSATLYPTLCTLVDHGYLSRDDHKRYCLGLKVLERSGQVLAQLDVRRVARPYLRDLARRRQVTADLAILYGNEVLYLEREAGHPAAILSAVVGRRVPLHCTSLGKALLAFLPDTERDDLVHSLLLDPYTANTITDPGKLLEELETTRQRGYALDIEEFHFGTACVGAPIRRHGGDVVAAISLMLTETSEIQTTHQEDVFAVIQTASAISSELGFATSTRDDEVHGGDGQRLRA